MSFREGGTGRGFFGFGDDGNILTGISNNSISLRSENDLFFGTGGNNVAMTISGSNQYVGIGTTNPIRKLHVYGTGTQHVYVEGDTTGDVGFIARQSGTSE
jgi:hypothetical protein